MPIIYPQRTTQYHRKEINMFLYITLQQIPQIKQLAKKHCANYMSGKCLEKDGAPCTLLDTCGCIRCAYFIIRVLPDDKVLYRQIKRQNPRKL